uniref:hypothetical protein n=1 Tax=Micromonospora viridifaciens TaxID=1881 RepID=UPI0012FE2CA8|nr:hypothetical protein [Micromonospora viridifaciens]
MSQRGGQPEVRVTLADTERMAYATTEAEERFPRSPDLLLVPRGERLSLALALDLMS